MGPDTNRKASTSAYDDKSICILIQEVTHLTKRMDTMENDAELSRMNSVALHGLQAQLDQLMSCLQAQRFEHGLLQEEVQNLSKLVAMDTDSGLIPANIQEILDAASTKLRSLQHIQGAGTTINVQALRQEVSEERRQVEEMLENITAKKLEVIEVMHTFEVSKQQAFYQLAAIMDNFLNDTPSGVHAKEQSHKVSKGREQVGTSVGTQSMFPSGRFMAKVRAATGGGISPNLSPVRHSRAEIMSAPMSNREPLRSLSAEGGIYSGTVATEHLGAPARQPSVQSREYGSNPSAISGEPQRGIGRQVVIGGDPHKLTRSLSPPHAAQSMATKDTALLRNALFCPGPRAKCCH